MVRAGESVRERLQETLGKIFIEEQSSGHAYYSDRFLCRRKRQQPPLTLRREAQAREHVFMSQLREVGE